MKIEPNTRLVNNYFDVALKAWQAIMAIINQYKSVTFMFLYFCKTGDQYFQTLKQAAKEAFKSNMHHKNNF